MKINFKIFTLLTTITLVILATSNCKPKGSEFIGEWVSSSKYSSNAKITKDGDSFIWKDNDGKFLGKFNDGLLKFSTGFGEASVKYDDKNDNIIVFVMGKESRYKRSKLSKSSKSKVKKSSSDKKAVGLTWSRPMRLLNWKKAKLKCKAMKMRLPTIEEWARLQKKFWGSSWLNKGCNKSNIYSCMFWSSKESSAKEAEIFNVYDDSMGQSYFAQKSAKNNFRCVR